MTHRSPRPKDQARLLREVFAAKGHPITHSDALELSAKLNGYPSWNVAAKTLKSTVAESKSGGVIDFQFWTAVHSHRHGEDLFYFDHEPTEQEAIEKIEGASSWEPEDESIEIQGPATFEIPLPTSASQFGKLSSQLIGVYEVNMTELATYEAPEADETWRWVSQVSSFTHKGNGIEPGVWEMMVHHDKLRDALDEVPLTLRPAVDKALGLGAVWVLFHQG